MPHSLCLCPAIATGAYQHRIIMIPSTNIISYPPTTPPPSWHRISLHNLINFHPFAKFMDNNVAGDVITTPSYERRHVSPWRFHISLPPRSVIPIRLLFVQNGVARRECSISSTIASTRIRKDQRTDDSFGCGWVRIRWRKFSGERRTLLNRRR